MKAEPLWLTPREKKVLAIVLVISIFANTFAICGAAYLEMGRVRYCDLAADLIFQKELIQQSLTFRGHLLVWVLWEITVYYDPQGPDSGRVTFTSPSNRTILYLLMPEGPAVVLANRLDFITLLYSPGPVPVSDPKLGYIFIIGIYATNYPSMCPAPPMPNAPSAVSPPVL